MPVLASDHTDTYDRAASRWGDKMRTLGYYDGYLGFLSETPQERRTAGRVVDVGAGTAAFSEAWTAINGVPEALTLLEPSQGMLERADRALQRRGVKAKLVRGYLADYAGRGYDEVLAAHVIEH